jgi:hypothetical protein
MRDESVGSLSHGKKKANPSVAFGVRPLLLHILLHFLANFCSFPNIEMRWMEEHSEQLHE